MNLKKKKNSLYGLSVREHVNKRIMRISIKKSEIK